MRFQSKRLGNRVLIKREDLQPVFAFKIRGAFNKLYSLTDAQKKCGVIAASAGNHAQGVALAATRLNVKATIVMPLPTPEIKVRSVRNLGAHVVLHGDTFDEASRHAVEIQAREGQTAIHPYDDPDVIAGQGTIAMEILRQHPGPIHAVFVPVGGGGLIAGIAAYIKTLRPEILVIGVESEDSACLQAALKAGRRVVLPQVGLFADGVAVARIGKEPFRIARTCVDGVITVSTDEICAAIKDIFDDTRSVAEPAGALSLAGLTKYVGRKRLANKTLVAIESGANVNFDRLRNVAERAELGEKREALLAVTLQERPGSLRDFCSDLGRHKITEFNYRIVPDGDANIFLGVQVRPGGQDRLLLIRSLRRKGYAVTDLTDNEMAKSHVRYMVGGRSHSVKDEIIFRLEFPERPGALGEFMARIGSDLNISLFHYRNHGDAFGRVAMGMEIPPDQRDKVRALLAKLPYNCVEETSNPAFQLFLKDVRKRQ
jgi:threonine dehydratase